MKTRFLIVVVLCLWVGGLSGCDDNAKKKARAEQETTKNGMKGNPGAYTPTPLNTSMTPRATPTPTPAQDSR
ncbi:MAG: hypothetical protein INR62_02740 [Rhodospirillales bacterium]|nr:hypothetical protein [Acetobacter sp.]